MTLPEDSQQDPLELTIDALTVLPRTASLLERQNPEAVLSGASYQVLSKLGEGAMGMVHLVRDLHLEREVAFKQLIGASGSQSEAVRRFLGEVQITAQLSHPSIVPVYSLEQTDKGLGYTMKQVQGDTFKELIQAARAAVSAGTRRPPHLSRQTLIAHFLKVCDALAYAHYRGVIHRDLKPANLMLGAHQEVYVMDWGIARPFGAAAAAYPFEAEEAGKLIGTPRYASPEQARGLNAQLDPRSDIFALGLILHELLCLQPAYTGKGREAMLERVRQAQRDPCTALPGDEPLPPALIAIVDKATAWKRAHRYASVQELAADLQRYLRDEPVQAAPDPPLEALLRGFRRHRVRVLSGVFVSLLLSAGLSLGSLWQRQQTLAAAAAEEARQAQFWEHLLQQGQQAERQLQMIPRVLAGLAGAGLQALESPPRGRPLYYLDDASWPQKVPDQIDSSFYKAPVSIDWTGFSIAYTRSEADLQQQLWQLAPLRHRFRQLMLRSAGPEAAADPRQSLTVTGAPVMFASLATEEGLLQYFPGISYNTPNYDPRQRPFYTLAAHKQGLQCGNPYLDRLVGSLLPCSLPLYDASGRFRGVAVADSQFNQLARTVLSLPDASYREAFLLDAEGRILLRSSDRDRQIQKQDQIQGAHTLQPFADSALQQAIAAREGAGYLENRQRRLGYLRLNFQGWYYVLLADTPGLPL
ncbi:MAG: protein kinase [Candidatus Sericytochromatia bacterium]|nr:protein kinase [Candidatus Sericytochromatia bacterium]